MSDEAVTINVIAGRINSVLLECGISQTGGRQINDMLVERDYLKIVQHDGKNYKVVTEKGKNIGIVTEEREIRGQAALINLYDSRAQKAVCEMMTPQ